MLWCTNMVGCSNFQQPKWGSGLGSHPKLHGFGFEPSNAPGIQSRSSLGCSGTSFLIMFLRIFPFTHTSPCPEIFAYLIPWCTLCRRYLMLWYYCNSCLPSEVFPKLQWSVAVCWCQSRYKMILVCLHCSFSCIDMMIGRLNELSFALFSF